MKKIWLPLFILFLVPMAYGQSDEEIAIKKVLEKESATWRSGDIKGHAECWQIRPYSRIIVSAIDGTVTDVPPEIMLNPPASFIGNGGSSVNSNYKMHINGNSACVSHNEESTAKDGQKSYSYEFRILEKINGQWKLTGQSLHFYQPK
ncbi:MAG: endo-arabinase [Flavobacterium sp.]|nr:endo-arabinase [Flavobacterium sp.]MBP8157330.1 endo-arabinase [Flavobacterium sp.]